MRPPTSGTTGQEADVKIHSPAEGYTGTDVYGETVLQFEDGVADFDGDLPPGVKMYLEGRGYGFGSKKAEAPAETPEPADPREIGDGSGVEAMGTRLRDAAVDPQPEDFLAPINAGQENPHGSKVVSPEIHASGPSGIVPGNVFVEDPEKQEQREKEYAEARLIEQVPAAEAVDRMVPDIDDHGPLGLSDPGSVEQGIEGAKEVAAAEAEAEKAREESGDVRTPDSVSPDTVPATPETIEPTRAKPAAAKKAAAKRATAKKSTAKKS